MDRHTDTTDGARKRRHGRLRNVRYWRACGHDWQEIARRARCRYAARAAGWNVARAWRRPAVDCGDDAIRVTLPAHVMDAVRGSRA